jgi:hypothetical protein
MIITLLGKSILPFSSGHVMRRVGLCNYAKAINSKVKSQKIGPHAKRLTYDLYYFMRLYFDDLYSCTTKHMWYACILFSRTCIILIIGMHVDCYFMHAKKINIVCLDSR